MRARAVARWAYVPGLAICLLLGTSFVDDLRAGVDVDGDLMLGTWSLQRTRFVARVPACVHASSERADDSGFGATAYRISAGGNGTGDRFTMDDGAGATIEYRVWWYDEADGGRREELRPGRPSRRAYPYRDRAACSAGDASGLEARARRRDVSRARPGIYGDTLRLTVSPI